MSALTGVNFSSCLQVLDIAADAETRAATAPVTPPAAPAKPRFPVSAPRPRNFTSLPQLRDHHFTGLVNARAGRQRGGGLVPGAPDNGARGMRDFAASQLKNIPLDQRLAWLRDQHADRAMYETMGNGSAAAIEAWAEVLELLPETARFAFLGQKSKGDGNAIATNIFNNSQPDAMRAWGKLLDLVPDRHRARSQLLLARTNDVEGTPALAILLEKGEKQALDQFVDLASRHVWHGDDDIHHVLFDCLPALKTLTSRRGKVSGLDALDWVRPDGLKYTRPDALSLYGQETANAYGKLMRLVPGKYRADLFFPEEVWSNFPGSDGDAKRIRPELARELAHSITLLKAMVPTMSAAERATVLNEIRSRHATKSMGFWSNTAGYEKFKRTWPAVDAMLLDLKAELKKAPPTRERALGGVADGVTGPQPGGDVDASARMDRPRGIHAVAVDELKAIAPTERLAWLRNVGADKSMRETMRNGSAEAIGAWAEVLQLLPEAARFAFLAEKVKAAAPAQQHGIGDFVADLASGVTKMLAPTAVRITPVGWGLVDNASGAPVQVSTALGATAQNLAQDVAQHLIGDSAKLFFPAKHDEAGQAIAPGKLRLTGTLDFDFSYDSGKSGDTDNGHGDSIAASVFGNVQPDAMQAWGKLLALVPDRNGERSKLLFARLDDAAGTPALALLFERGEKRQLDQFVALAGRHTRLGDDDIHHVLFDVLPALNVLTSQRGNVHGSEAQDWVRPDGLGYTRPHELSLTAQGTAQAYADLMRLVPGKYRNDLYFPEHVWANFPGKNGDAKQLGPDGARALAHSITLLKAMVPTMSAGERNALLNEIRSRHATLTLGFWRNTSGYEKFKRTWPAVDAMLLDLKAELKQAPPSST